jgi:hypothetical protein
MQSSRRCNDVPMTSYDIDDWRLREAVHRRKVCLENNGHRCNTCSQQFASSELFTLPDLNQCFCKSCWLGGDYKKSHKRKV